MEGTFGELLLASKGPLDLVVSHVKEYLGILVGSAYNKDLVEWNFGDLSCILARFWGSLSVDGCLEKLQVCDWQGRGEAC